MKIARHQTTRIIRDPAEFQPEHRRLIRVMVSNAVKKGLIHYRDANWADYIINAGQARAMLLDDKLAGFFSIKHFSDNKYGSVVYGESCLWKTGSAEITKMIHNALLDEASLIGTSIYGAYYRNNNVAKEFYSPEKGWQVIDTSQYPASMMGIVNDYLDELTLSRHALN